MVWEVILKVPYVVNDAKMIGTISIFNQAIIHSLRFDQTSENHDIYYFFEFPMLHMVFIFIFRFFEIHEFRPAVETKYMRILHHEYMHMCYIDTYIYILT